MDDVVGSETTETTDTVEQTTTLVGNSAPEKSGSVTFNYNDLINSDGTFKPEFHSKLPEEIGKHSSIQKYTNIVDLVKGTINASSLIGKKGEDFWKSTDPVIVAKRHEIMGVPSDPKDYGLTKPTDIPEDAFYDNEALNEFAVMAKELGLPKETAQKLIDFDAKRYNSATEKIKTATEQYKAQKIDEIKKEWGTKFEYNDAKATQIAEHLGIKDLLLETGLSHEPLVLKALLEKIGPAISEDKLVETAKTDNYATISDGLLELENKMLTTDRGSAEYSQLVKARTELLMKLSK
jgi:hypothetical protein